MVDYDLRNIKDSQCGLAFFLQIFHARRFGAKEPVANAVGDESMDCLRHRTVAAAKPRLDVGNRNVEFFGHNRAGESGVHITNHKYTVRAFLLANLLKGHHDLGSLLGMTATTTFEMMVRLGYAQLFKKYVAHITVIMLAGMNNTVLEPIAVVM